MKILRVSHTAQIYLQLQKDEGRGGGNAAALMGLMCGVPSVHLLEVELKVA